MVNHHVDWIIVKSQEKSWLFFFAVLAQALQIAICVPYMQPQRHPYPLR